MSRHTIEIDVQRVAQDIKNIRHFLDHLEKSLESAISTRALKEIEDERANSASSSHD